MKESDIQTVFRDFNNIDGVFELKLCKNNKPFPFSNLKDHQRDALLAANSPDGFFHKLIDPPVFEGMKTRFNQKRPFDCFRLSNIPAYVVICWYMPRRYKQFFYIPIWIFVEEKEQSKRKSLTRLRAAAIAEFIKDV